MKQKIKKLKIWFSKTKLGHFIILFGLSVLIECALLFTYPKLFIPAISGSLFTAIFICTFDGNKRFL